MDPLASSRADEVPRDLPLEPRRVLHDPRLGPARADRGGRRWRAQRRRALGPRAATGSARSCPRQRLAATLRGTILPEARGARHPDPGLGGDGQADPRAARQYFERSCSRSSRRSPSTRRTRSRSSPTCRSRSRSRLATRSRRTRVRARQGAGDPPALRPLGRFDAGRPAAAAADGAQEFVLLEKLIEANLDDLFPGMEILGAYPFRVTRDTDIEIREDEADDLLSIIDRELRRRRFGACVRLEVDAGIPERVRRLLSKARDREEDVYDGDGPLGLRALMSIAEAGPAELRDPPFVAASRRAGDEAPSMFAPIRKGDILLHHPYDSFEPVLDVPAQRRRRSRRPGDQDDALPGRRRSPRWCACSIRAAENGKQVAVSVELKARFDEENNIEWARALERPASTSSTDVELKTHAKIGAGGAARGRAACAATSTSPRATTTGDRAPLHRPRALHRGRRFGEDASELFNWLSGFSKKARYRKLAVAPMALSDAMLAQDRGADRAARGRQARRASSRR